MTFSRIPPVYSFGDPAGKQIAVVGQNPSQAEYVSGYLSKSSDIELRRQSQLTYFDRRHYPFFAELEKFFQGRVKELLGWASSPWDKVGYLDLVKCSTTAKNGGQWSKIPQRKQESLVRNCQVYLIAQLELYAPDIVIPYGADVGRWFSRQFNVPYEEFEDRKSQLNKRDVKLLFIPQRQGPHSKPEILWVRHKIASMLSNQM